MKNLHINMNEFTNASRVLKQVDSLIKNNIFDEILILALGGDNLPDYEVISDSIQLQRITLRTRSLPKNIFFSAIKYMEFSTKALYHIYKAKPDVINAHSLQLLPIAIISKKILNSKLIYDAHELETEKNGLFGLKKTIGKIIEKNSIKHIDMVLVVSESIADWYSNEYRIKRPTVLLNAPKKRKLKHNDYFRNQLGISNDQTIFLYQGGLMRGRGIELLLDSFKSRVKSKAVIVFMGYGVLESEIKSAARDFDNIFFLPAVPPDIVLEYTASADVGISLIENICLSYYYCMPNKLFEYCMAGLPILASNMKDMSQIINENDIGIVIEELSVKGVNEAIDSFLCSNLTNMKNNAYKVALENSWEKQEIKMINAYTTLIKRKSSIQ